MGSVFTLFLFAINSGLIQEWARYPAQFLPTSLSKVHCLMAQKVFGVWSHFALILIPEYLEFFLQL